MILPWLYKKIRHSTGGTDSALYCYGVWLRHLKLLHKYTGLTEIPKTIFEVGPGDSIGTGLAAMLCGSDEYYAYDVVDFTDIEKNLIIFDELLKFFKNKRVMPKKEFPNMMPRMENLDFPSDILTEDLLKRTLDPERIERIRNVIKNHEEKSPSEIKINLYFGVRFKDLLSLKIDFIFSQGAMQYIDDVDEYYSLFYKILPPGGLVSTQMGFASTKTGDAWYDHWTYSDMEWKIISGKKICMISRRSYTEHVEGLKRNNLSLIKERVTRKNDIPDRKKLHGRFKELNDDDLAISSAYFLTKKQ